MSLGASAEEIGHPKVERHGLARYSETLVITGELRAPKLANKGGTAEAYAFVLERTRAFFNYIVVNQYYLRS